MTDQNLKNDTNLTTNHQSDESTANKSLFIDWDTSSADVDKMFDQSGIDEDNYSLLLNGPFSERWAELLDE